MSLDTSLFGEPPARDERFTVAETWSSMTNLPLDDPEAIPEFLHRQMNEELNSIEISAANLTDFPEADWELRLEIARQCYDEARHAEAFRRCLESRGGRVGQYPVLNFQYRIIRRIGSLIGRLAVQNRSFEAAGIDAIQDEISRLAESGEDPDLGELFEAQLADEIHHVRYANQWVKRLIDRDGPRAILALTRAVESANTALPLVAGEGATMYPVADELRREAGFTDAEIEAARKLTHRGPHSEP